MDNLKPVGVPLPEIIPKKIDNKIKHRVNDKNRCEHYFNEFCHIIDKKGGKCTSTQSEYKDTHTNLNVICQDGHEFTICLNNAQKNRWCPKCRIYQGEALALDIICKITGKQFEKVRPNWLKNKKGNNLELDMYSSDLHCAIEYQGEQHDHFMPHFHKSQNEFNNRIKDDKVKEEICKDHGVTLIKIPHTQPLETLHEYIIEKCKENAIPLITEEYDYDQYNYQESKLNKIKKIIQQKEGEYISGTYIDRKSKITIKCNHGHVFESTMKYIKHGAWCQTCGTVINDDRKQKIADGMKKMLQTDKGKAMKKLSHEKRSETMAKEREELRSTLTEKPCKGPYCNGAIKSIDNFGNKKDTKDGHQPWCKSCVNNFKRQRRLDK